MIIYKSTNIINNKCYIGQTIKTLEQRCKEHHYRGFIFYKALKKYGIDNFEWEVIDDTCQTKEELDEMEYHYIKQYHSHMSEYGYNLTYGGDGVHGWKMSDEQRVKLSNSHKGKIFTEEHKKKLSIVAKNRVYSDETRKKLSLSSTGINNPNSKIYTVIHPSGKEETVKCLKIFCEKHNISYNTMISIIIGKVFHCKGFKIKGYNNDKKVLFGYEITSPDGMVFVVDSLTTFCNKYNLGYQSMSQVARGYRPKYKGYYCRKILL